MIKPTRLLNKNFVLLWQGQLVSQLGTQAYAIAMMFWIKHETGSATLMGLIMMVSQLPAVLLGPIGGTVADRRSRKAIIVLSDLINGIVVLGLAILVFLTPSSTDLIIIALFVVGVIASTVGAFFRPAVSAAIPDIVPGEKLAAANSMNQFSVQGSTLLGQGIGGVLYRVLGAPLLFLIDGITYIFSAISEMFITIPQKLSGQADESSPDRRFWSDIKDGFAYIWANHGLRHLFMAAAFINFFLIPSMVLLPFFVEDFLMATPDWFGYIVASFGAGAMVGYVIAGAVRLTGRARSSMVLVSMVLMSALIGVLGLIENKSLAMVDFFAVGLLNGIVNINIATILQQTTPSEIRGRVFGVLTTLSGGLAPLAMGLTGVIADLLDQNIPLILILSGSISTVLCAILSLSAEFRRFMAYEPVSNSSNTDSQQS